MNSCFFLFTGPIPPSKSIPQLQEDSTQTITTSTTAEPEHQTPTSTIATLRKETTVTRETGILQLLLSSWCRVCNEKKLNLPALWCCWRLQPIKCKCTTPLLVLVSSPGVDRCNAKFISKNTAKWPCYWYNFSLNLLHPKISICILHCPLLICTLLVKRKKWFYHQPRLEIISFIVTVIFIFWILQYYCIGETRCWSAMVFKGLSSF